MNKRGVFAVIVFSLVFSSVFAFLISSVSAAGFFGSSRDISQNVINSWVNFLEPILQALFGGFGWNGMFLFERLLLFIVLICIVYLAVGRIPMFEEKKVIRWTIAIIVPLIGMRFIHYEWLNAIIVQYTALAVILTSVIPFLIYFFFIYSVAEDFDILRKVFWLLFIGIYAGLWSTAGINESTIYAWTTVAAIICLIFDTKIMRRYRSLQLMKSRQGNSNEQLVAIDRKIAELNEALRNHWGDPKLTQKQIKDLTKHRAWLIKQV